MVCPVRFTKASTSANVASGVMLESLVTNPALNFFTLRTISACDSIGCEPKINDNPPFRASAIANPESETDCIIAETNGMFSSMADFSPFLYFTKGVFNETLVGIHCFVVRPGISRYSPKVLDTSSK